MRIETLDNPGWLVTINLVGTPLAGRAFAALADAIGPDDHPDADRWISCVVRDGAWRGAGDETQLARLLGVFLDWAETDPDPATAVEARATGLA